MADRITPEDILRLALLANDGDALRKLFRDDRDLFLLAARGGLGPACQETALPVILDFLEEEQRAGRQQPLELAPLAPTVEYDAATANTGVREERPPPGQALTRHSSVMSVATDIRPSSVNALGHGIGPEQMGCAVSTGGACWTGHSDVIRDGGVMAPPTLDPHDGNAEETVEGSSPGSSATDSISSIASHSPSATALERCDECVRAWAICTQSPLIADPPTTCIRCSLRGLLCRPPSEVENLLPPLETPLQQPSLPTAVYTGSSAGPPGGLPTLLATVQRLNALMAEANERGEIMWQLHSALRGAIRSAESALGCLGRDPAPGASQVASESLVMKADALPPPPRQI
ncbi:hypothetical protein FB107DRAFT_279553 [Schizophyllum commune]